MARTVNRNPYTVNIPSSSENKEYFFNHYNWKGMSDDKNFLTSDQETFESCNNVYVDDEGLLRSRPSFKSQIKPCKGSLLRFWTVDEFTVFLSRHNAYYLTFVKNDDAGYRKEFKYNSEVALVSVNDKIFIFTDDGLKYFDKSDGTIKDGTDYIYVPESSIKSGAEELEGENRNLLTNKHKVVYLYVPGDTNNNFLLGKDVTIKVEDETYSLKFDADTISKLYTKKIECPTKTSLDNVLVGCKGEAIWIYDRTTHQFLYSPDGKLFTRSILLEASVYVPAGDPFVSADGTTLFVFLTIELEESPRLYRVSLVKEYVEENELAYRYPTLEKVYVGVTDIEGSFGYFLSHDRGIALESVYDGNNTWPDYTAEGIENIDYAIYAVYVDGDVSKRLRINEYQENGQSFYNYYGPPLGTYSDFDSVTFFFKYGYIRLEYDKITDNSISKDGLLMSRYYINGSLMTAINISVNNDADRIALAVTYANNFLLFYGSCKNLIDKDDTNLNGLSQAWPSPQSPDAYSYLVCANDKIGLLNNVYDTVKNKYYTPLNTNGNFYPLAAAEHIIYPIYDGWLTLYSTEPSEATIRYIDEYDNTPILNNLNQAKYLPFNGHLFGFGNSLCHTVTKYNDDNEFMWYIPDYTEEKLPENITDLVTISSTEVAALSAHQIWNVSVTDSGYAYHKSKLQAGLREGAKTLTLYGGDSILFANDRGLLSLGYKDFVATTDQSLSYLSDIIMKDFVEFCSGKVVNIVQHKHLIICYNGSDKFFFFDLRNNSWWPMTAPFNISKMFILNDELIITSPSEWYKFDYSDEDYKDYGTTTISWNIKSQKLHLSAINYHKHISNITLISVLDSNELFDVKLKVTNYRNTKADSEVEVKEFKVDTIRTHVQRLSFPKVNEFQYELTNDDQKYIGVPLSLSGISIKYRIGGQVR